MSTNDFVEKELWTKCDESYGRIQVSSAREDLSVIPYREYVYSECVRQWHEIQEEDGLGPWESQSEEEQHEYFEDMYEHLWDDRFELDYVTIPRRKEKNAWKRLRREGGMKR